MVYENIMQWNEWKDYEKLRDWKYAHFPSIILPPFYYEGRRKEFNGKAFTDWYNSSIEIRGNLIGSRARQIFTKHALNTPAHLAKYILHITSFHDDCFHDYYHGGNGK